MEYWYMVFEYWYMAQNTLPRSEVMGVNHRTIGQRLKFSGHSRGYISYGTWYRALSSYKEVGVEVESWKRAGKQKYFRSRDVTSQLKVECKLILNTAQLS